jgi:hypothetical protein
MFVGNSTKNVKTWTDVEISQTESKFVLLWAPLNSRFAWTVWDFPEIVWVWEIVFVNDTFRQQNVDWKLFADLKNVDR